MGKDVFDLIAEHLAMEPTEPLEDLVRWLRTLLGKSERDEVVHLLGLALGSNLDSRRYSKVFAEALFRLAEIEEEYERSQT